MVGHLHLVQFFLGFLMVLHIVGQTYNHNSKVGRCRMKERPVGSCDSTFYNFYTSRNLRGFICV